MRRYVPTRFRPGPHAPETPATAQSDSTPAARDGPAVQRVCRSLCGVMGVLGAMGGVRARMGQHGWERGAFDHDGVLNASAVFDRHPRRRVDRPPWHVLGAGGPEKGGCRFDRSRRRPLGESRIESSVTKRRRRRPRTTRAKYGHLETQLKTAPGMGHFSVPIRKRHASARPPPRFALARAGFDGRGGAESVDAGSGVERPKGVGLLS